jgi:ubiquinone/menaquinone biosynthesis C-methylase UbiE
MDAEGWDRRYDTADYVWHVAPNQFLPELVADLTPGRAVDLACGEGRNAVWLAQQGWTCTAVDFSQVGIAKAERLAADSGVTVEWVVADVTTVDLPAAGYDLVIVFYVQIPPPDRQAMLHRAARALAPGGRFVMVAHDLTNITEGVGGPQDPSVMPTPELISADLRSAGVADLTIDRAETVPRRVVTSDGSRDAIDCLVVAHRA